MLGFHHEETWQVRAIWLKSERYQLIGKSDLIELAEGEFYPVEYKRGRRGEWDNDELQVCAQALCLEEMTGKTIAEGYVCSISSTSISRNFATIKGRGDRSYSIILMGTGFGFFNLI